MKNSRLIAIITIAALSVALTACSGNEANPTLEDGAKTAKSTAVAEVTMSMETAKPVETKKPVETAKPEETTAPTDEKPEIRINTELLDEFGMTFAELEEKHGSATRGEDNSATNNDTVIYRRLTYFFKNSIGGYTFWGGESEEDVQGVLSDGTLRVKDIDKLGNRIEFREFNGQMKELFFGMNESMTVKELNDFNEKHGLETGQQQEMERYYMIALSYDHFVIIIEYDKDGLIESNSKLRIVSDPEGTISW